MKTKVLIGAHTSIQGGVVNSLHLAHKLNFNSIQIFTKNNNQWRAKELTDKEIENFSEYQVKYSIEFIMAHSSYLINLCSDNKETLEKSRNSLIDEIMRCSQLGIKYLNFHPGAYGKNSLMDGVKLIAESLNIVHEKSKDYGVFSVIETTAGQGTSVGHRFEQIKEIIDLVEEKDRIRVCIDTAHIFAAGYELREKSGYEKTMKDFDEIIGLKNLISIHVNDSKKDFGSKVDRHEHIGKGKIGLDGFRNIMNDEQLSGVPKILETPKGKEQLEDLENIKVLMNLVEV